MYDAAAKIIMFIIIVLLFIGMIYSSIYNAIQVSLLKTELNAVNQTWQNSNQSTFSALQSNDLIKHEYSKRFYTALTLIKEPNEESMCLNEKLSKAMDRVLDLPPPKLKIDDGYKREEDNEAA
ncbi:hypothetical protein [Francisella philomiragia]|uniref:Uncharacterized protein n=1 Tax=Francisella philomiragia TaxID=28110 RepID=A0A0B6CUE9_9GAMM|nr:hypothetical protein [Francisella philomiragia]AJI52440.1 hypothetical protein LA55_1239 [Francisella philomiragia]